MSEVKQLSILYVEDSEVDFEIAERAFKKVGLELPLTRCSDGEEALDYLFRRGDFTDEASCPRPDLILLDLNLPGISGRDVLMRVKQSPELCTIPIIVLTTSCNRDDVEFCYQHGANTYIPKPIEFEDFVQSARVVSDYWDHMAFSRRMISDS